MKRILKAQPAPLGLSTLLAAQPAADWDTFRQSNAGVDYRAVKAQLVSDQRHLCAYCETQLQVSSPAPAHHDFRVEHFHPKSDTSTPYNWALDWNNLLGICHGGSSKNVQPSSNFLARHVDRHCDVHKKDLNWTGQMLNPLQIAPLDQIFDFDRLGLDAGKIKLHTQCPAPLQQQAQFTIDNLNLNTKRIKDARSAVIATVTAMISSELQSGNPQPDLTVAQQFFGSTASDWPAFFTAIRSTLGAEADTFLSQQNYQG